MNFAKDKIQKFIINYASDNCTKTWTIKKTVENKEETQNIKQRMKNKNIYAYVFYDNKNYHKKFFNIVGKPKIIFAWWDISLLERNIIGIVWPREYTKFGEDLVKNLCTTAISYNIVTISWLARGIDTLAHQFSIKNNMQTIAVLAWWMRWFSTSNKRWLLQKIITNSGLVLSEYPLDTKPYTYTFPERNRIIAWLSDIVYIPEASEKSWSMITAKFAKKSHKHLYCSPNSPFVQTSYWTNKLLAQKIATIVNSFEKMLDKHFSSSKSYKIHKQKKNNKKNLSSLENKIIVWIKKNMKEKNLLQFCNIDINKFYSTLTMLEIEWIIYQKEPWVFEISQNVYNEY